MQTLGIETLALVSDSLDSAGSYVNGSSQGVWYEEAVINKLGFGGEGFHDYCRGRALVQKQLILQEIADEKATIDVLKLRKCSSFSVILVVANHLSFKSIKRDVSD